MATVKFMTEKRVQIEVEFDIKDGVYYIGSLSGSSNWGKYYKVERIDIEDSKITFKAKCLYLDSIEINGKTLNHGVDKYEFERITKIQNNIQEELIHGQMELITEDLFLAYYNETMDNINKRMAKTQLTN